MRKKILPWLLSVLSACSVVNSTFAADAPITIENVRVGFGETSGAQGYKIGTWTPVWVELKAGKDPFKGFLDVRVTDDAGLTTTTRKEIAVPVGEGFTKVVAYCRPGNRFGEINVNVRDEAGRSKANWASGGGVESFGPETSIVLTTGKPAGIAEMKDLPKFAVTGYSGASAPFVVLSVRPSDGFPGRWYGLGAADALVLDTNDQATMSRISASAPSIRQWVAQGGHLVVAVGLNWQSVKDSPLEPMLPAVIAGRVRLTDKAVLEAFAGNSTHPIKNEMQVTKFEDWEARGGVSLAASTATPLVLRGTYGFGRVTMVGIDVDQEPFASWEDKKAFWDKTLDLRGTFNNPDIVANPSFAPMSGEMEFGTQLNGSLQQFPGVRLIPFGWVAFFVFLYILLIGPGDYLFLRKVVKRMELTWITFPAIVIAVSALAYAAAYAFKGTDLRINKVDVVDMDQTRGLVRGTSWLTVFSPQNRDYGLSIVPLSPESEPPTDPIAPANSKVNPNVETLVTWFGSEGSNLGGGAIGITDSGYEYGPLGEVEQLSGVRIIIWGTKSFTAKWLGPLGTPFLESDVAASGPDRLMGTITNNSRRPLKHAAVFFGRFAYLLGDGNLAPGQTATINTLEAKPLSTYLFGIYPNATSPNEDQIEGNEQQVESNRASLVGKMLFRDSLGGRGGQNSSISLRSLDLTTQLDLGRPILMAEVDGPGTLIKLEGAGSTPKMKQTTLVRVILPLKPSTDAKP